MSVVNVENIDLAAWYVNEPHSRCCCKPSYPDSRCAHCKPTFMICCLQATVGTNVRKHILARWNGPDLNPWSPGDPCDELGSHNLCGALRALFEPGTDSCMSDLSVAWTVSNDCETVLMSCNGIVRELPRDWYTSPQTFSNPDGRPDVTLENCAVPTVVLPVVTETNISIVGELWSLGANPGDPDIKTDQRTRGFGNDICGSGETCPGEGLDWNWYCNLLRWRLLDDLETIEFTIERASGGLCGGSSTLVTGEVPWGTGVNGTGTGDWFDNTPIIIPVSGGYWKLHRVSTCGQPPPPCDVENACWPDLCPCLVDGETGEIYRTIYADVSGDHTETELSLEPDDAAGRYQWTRGSDAITILCMNGGVDAYMVTVILGADSYFCTIPANGLQCDGLELVDEIIDCGDISIRLYTL